MTVARRSLQVVAFVCTLIVGVAAMAVIVTQTTWFKEWLRGFIVRQADDYVNGRLSIGRLDGNLFFGVELENVAVAMNGETVVAIDDVGIDYNAFTFLRGDVVLDDLRLNQPTLRLERTEEGWNLARLIRARTPDPDAPRSRRTIAIGEIGVSDGTLHIEEGAVGTAGVDVPARIENLNASVGVESDAGDLTVDVGHVSLRAEEPPLRIADLSGTITRTADAVRLENVSLRTEESSLRIDGTIRNIEEGPPAVDLTASSDKLALDEIARVVTALRGYEMQPAFEVAAKGPADRLDVTLNVREQNLGTVIGDLTVDAEAPGRRVAGSVTMEHLNVGPVARSDTLKSDITGQAQIDLALPSGQLPLSGTYSIDAPRVHVAGYEARDVVASGRIDGRTVRLDAEAAAYGGRATAEGTVTAGTPLALDLEGRAANLDLRNLPAQLNAPGVPSDLQLDYRLTGRGRVFSGDVRLRASTLAGATIAPGTTGSFRVGGGAAPEYSAEGAVRGLDLQQVGRGFGIDALAADRFESRVNAAFDVKGSGGGANPLNLDASAVMTDARMFGAAVPHMDVTAALAGPDLHVTAQGQVEDLDPAVVTGSRRVAGEVSAAVDVQATLRSYREGVTVDSIDASGRVKLGQSQVAGLAIESAVVDGRYAGRIGEIDRLTISGPDVNAQAQGTLALTETGASNLQVRFESTSLARVGELIEQPLKGSALVDATVTGNAGSLQAAGTLEGSNIGYGENEALNLETTFSVTVPDLQPAEAAVKADSHATFLQLGGVDITELAAETTYRNQRLDFTVEAQEGVRELAAGGTVIFHPGHQEIHLPDLTLRAEDVVWQSAPGSKAAVQYGGGRIEVEDLRLLSGNQRIAAEGAIGSPSESLTFRAENVDVAQLDELVLLDHGISGRLDVTAAVSGPTDDLRAQGEFALTEGAFRDFTFEAFTGDVKFAGSGLTVDVRLQQDPQSWLTAEGYVPAALFQGPAEGDPGGAHAAPAAGEEIDLRVASSRIDLGVVQGFTSYVTDVTGALRADVRVTGAARDPHMEGAVDIEGGALTIPDLGTSYTGIDTRIDLEPDTVSIREMRIVDEHQNALTIGGTLGVHQLEVGAVDVSITSEDFEVIDNDLADLKLDTDVKITGQVRAPRVEGTVEVESGTIDVAEVLQLTTSDPYDIEETEAWGPPAPEGAEEAAEPSAFDALALAVSLSIPNNLVLQGDDIRPANAPIDIGDINVTVGGLLQIRKPRGTGEVQLVGEVNTVRGNYEFQGRRFELMRDGRIRFAGGDEINPLLDLDARRVISGVETFVNITGTMREPELQFRSNPPLGEADILSLIVFNAPINELGEGQQVSLAERAGALAGGYLASGLAQSIGSALELDEFEIQTQGETGAPTLTVGEQVGERLFFRVRQAFGAAQMTEFILEYQIADYLRLQGAVAETAGGAQRLMFRRVERAGLDLIFFFSY